MCCLHPQPFSKIFVWNKNFNGPPFLRLSLRMPFPQIFTYLNTISRGIKSNVSKLTTRRPASCMHFQKNVFPLISSNVGIHFLEHFGKHFTYLNQSHTVKLPISSNLTVTAAHSISNFQCWDRFDPTLYCANLAVCQHRIILP